MNKAESNAYKMLDEFFEEGLTVPLAVKTIKSLTGVHITQGMAFKILNFKHRRPDYREPTLSEVETIIEKIGGICSQIQPFRRKLYWLYEKWTPRNSKVFSEDG